MTHLIENNRSDQQTLSMKAQQSSNEAAFINISLPVVERNSWIDKYASLTFSQRNTLQYLDSLNKKYGQQSGGIFPNQGNIAKHQRCCRETINRAFKRLCELGFILDKVSRGYNMSKRIFLNHVVAVLPKLIQDFQKATAYVAEKVAISPMNVTMDFTLIKSIKNLRTVNSAELLPKHNFKPKKDEEAVTEKETVLSGLNHWAKKPLFTDRQKIIMSALPENSYQQAVSCAESKRGKMWKPSKAELANYIIKIAVEMAKKAGYQIPWKKKVYPLLAKLGLS